MLFRMNSKFIEIAVMPDLFHIIPRGNDTMLNGVSKLEDTSLGLGFFSDVHILLFGSNHGTSSNFGSADDGGEADFWCIFSGNSSLAHTGSIINDNGVDCFFAHD
jgi:hypothetical protein